MFPGAEDGDVAYGDHGPRLVEDGAAGRDRGAGDGAPTVVDDEGGGQALGAGQLDDAVEAVRGLLHRQIVGCREALQVFGDDGRVDPFKEVCLHEGVGGVRVHI